MNAKLDYANCVLNPVDGNAYVQNIAIGSSLDLGTLGLSFMNSCEGKANVSYATGKYEKLDSDNISLLLNQ
jgi:hypothetical protein